jgi:hypothetical protein
MVKGRVFPQKMTVTIGTKKEFFMKQIKNILSVRLFGFTAIALAIVISVTGCKNPLDDAGPTPVTIAAVQGVTAPVTGAAPVTAITATKQYTGTITWSPADNSFKASTVYTATISLKAKDGYTLKGVAANFFTVGGATTTNAANSGVITAVFPSTAGTTAEPVKIDMAAIAGVTAPVTGAAPVTAITATQYAGTVTWSPAVSGTFAASTVYTATITLTAKNGFTLTGVAADFFTVTGATATNAANSGVITAVFPATGESTENIITGGGNGGGSGGSGNGGGGGDDTTPTFTSVSEFAAYLAGKSANTAGTSYSVKLNIKNEDMEDLKTLLLATDKYVYLDLSGSTITKIPDEAFLIYERIEEEPFYIACATLTGITIPNSVTSIGDFAFTYCTGLTSVTIGNNVTSIGRAVFVGCTSLTAINVGAGNGTYTVQDGILYSKNKTTLIVYPAGKTGAFTIPNSVTSIEQWAFAFCTSLTSVTIGNSVKSIGMYAFAICTSLTSVTIGNSVKSIGECAFVDCKSLTSITIPDSVTTIEYSAFYGCASLTSITIPNSVNSIEEWAFAVCTSLTSVTIPNSVTSIEQWAFVYCTSLTSITIPNSVNSIGEWAFSGCTSLTSVTFQGTIAEDDFEYSAFYYGDLRDKYLAGGKGTYVRESDSYTWEKQE